MEQARTDRDAVARLLGRPPAGAFTVVLRRPDGTPAVIENAPLLDDGRPMPTLYWLVDATLREAVSRLEAAGGVRRAAEAVRAEDVSEAHERHALARSSALPSGHPGPLPSGGVGGTRQGVKCLHAHLAWYLVGGEDPVGRWTARELGAAAAGPFVHAPGPGPVAAVDCGTNSTRLIVIDQDGRVLERDMRITRLGEGVDATHLLSEDAIERVLTVLRQYRQVMDWRGVGRRRVVATSAARDALNAESFMKPAEEITGVRPEVLPGRDEGRLSFLGATAHLEVSAAQLPVLVTDIGGGSTELSIGTPGVPTTTRPVDTRSLDMGCVRVTERYLRHDPPGRAELGQARAAVEREVRRARDELPPLSPDSLLLGLAGTVSTLTSLVHGVSTYDRAQVHHSVLTRDEVEHWLARLAAETAEARLAHPGMVEGRQDVIVGGATVLASVMEVFGRDRCVVSEDDILDGLAAELLGSPD